MQINHNCNGIKIINFFSNQSWKLVYASKCTFINVNFSKIDYFQYFSQSRFCLLAITYYFYIFKLQLKYISITDINIKGIAANS